jgi:GNAT superfamily N-acetyltransferase
MSEILITSDQSKFDFDAIHDFLSNIYWSRDIPKATLKKAAENSLCFGAFWNGSQVGFARVVTDKATFAFLADVYVLESHRGRGIARELMNAVFSHPELQGIRRFLLSTRDAHGLYEKYGFAPLAAPERFMEIHKANMYSKPLS